jgi:hypothetical protein
MLLLYEAEDCRKDITNQFVIIIFHILFRYGITPLEDVDKLKYNVREIIQKKVKVRVC